MPDLRPWQRRRAPCGLWDTGFRGGLDPSHVIMYGVRELQGGERVSLDRDGVHRVDEPSQLAGLEVFVHTAAPGHAAVAAQAIAPLLGS